ncbi:hypothetical protein [uncultured Mitsuokella sp.]|nr:hypothetical protein [uncultured Mitsuokella sp.]
MKEVRIGLIGAGWMGHAHTRAYHNAKRGIISLCGEIPSLLSSFIIPW